MVFVNDQGDRYEAKCKSETLADKLAVIHAFYSYGGYR